MSDANKALNSTYDTITTNKLIEESVQPTLQERSQDRSLMSETNPQSIDQSISLRSSGFLTTLVIVQVGLVLWALWELRGWLVSFRGGLHLEKLFFAYSETEISKRPEVVNRHTPLCTLSIVVLLPVSYIFDALLRPKMAIARPAENSRIRYAFRSQTFLDVIIKLVTGVLLGLGLLEVYYHEKVEDKRFPFRVDMGIHYIWASPCCCACSIPHANE